MRRCIQEEFDVDMFRLIARSVNGVLRHPGIEQGRKRVELGQRRPVKEASKAGQ